MATFTKSIYGVAVYSCFTHSCIPVFIGAVAEMFHFILISEIRQNAESGFMLFPRQNEYNKLQTKIEITL